MKRLLLASFLLACGAPAQYTVVNANGNTNTTNAQATSWPNLAQWEADKQAPKDAAVIIAIEDYAFLPDVEGAVKNANDWEQYFRINRGMEDVFVLTNQDAPIEEIERFAKQAIDATSEDGTLWFVFIGHGAAKTDGTDGLIIGMDAQQTVESLTARSLAKGDIVKMLDKGKQANTVVVLDTCFSGRSPNGELLAQGTQPVIPVSTSPVTKSGFALLSAAKGDQVAGQLPGDSRPAFSYLLLGALRGWADNDGDKKVTTAEAVNYTQRQLRLLKGRQQTPDIIGEEHIVLAVNVSEADPGVSALMSGGGTIATNDPKPTIGGVGTKVDTGKGIVVPKMDQWVLPDRTFPGYLFYTQRMTERSIISVAMNKMSQMNAASTIANMSSEPPAIDGEWLEKPNEQTVGNHVGTWMSWKEKTEGFPEQSTHQFVTYQNGALFIFQLQLENDLELHAKRLPEFTTFIKESEFK